MIKNDRDCWKCFSTALFLYKEFMGKKLIITEKPSVAKSMAEVLGATNRKEGYFEGYEEGELKFLLKQIQKKLSKNKSYETISLELETDIEVIEQICKIIENTSSDSSNDDLVKILKEKNIKLHK